MAEQTMTRQSAFPMVPVGEALQGVLARAAPLEEVELPLDEALGLVLARDVAARDPHPPFAASLMDGYAVVAADGPGEYPVLAQRVHAGVDVAGMHVPAGSVAYITTGAPVPPGADAVVKVEDTEAVPGAEGSVRINAAATAGQSIRPLGCDYAAGEVLVPAGAVLTPAELGLCAAAGAGAVWVHRRPRVGVVSTGDELQDPDGAPLAPGKIRDSNTATLLAAIREAGAEARRFGRTVDDAGSLAALFGRAIEECDVVISSGGVSMGELDLVKPLLADLGTVHFGRVCMKPGKPTTFATVGAGERTLFFALPGNPVSCLVTFHLFVQPAVRRLGGRAEPDCFHAQVQARTASDIKLDPVRPEYHRAFLEAGGVAHSTGVQRSSRLLSMRTANALLCIPRAQGVLPAGSTVTALLIGPPAAPAAGASFHNGSAPEAAEPSGIRAAVLTVSDRVSRGEAEDGSGPAASAALQRLLGAATAHAAVVPDEAEQIRAQVEAWADGGEVDVVVLTGGTGFAARDVTPEAVRPALHKEAPGLVHALLAAGARHTPLYALSRPVAGVRGAAIVVTLPGKPKAVVEGVEALAPLLPHAVRLLQGERVH